jgi:hypothetical protein
MRGLGGNEREVQDEVEVEILRAKTALRMTAPGFTGLMGCGLEA